MERDDRVAFGPPARPIFWLVDREPDRRRPHRVPGRRPRARRRVPRRRARRRRPRQRRARACGPSTTRTTTARSSSTRTATTPKPSATRRNEHARLLPRAAPTPDDRLPPGQYLERGFPVLCAGPTPRTPLDEWTFSIAGAVDEERSWTWEEFQALPQETPTVDIHCVTTWSKFDTTWVGVSVDTLLDGHRAARRLRHRLLRRRLHDQPPDRGHHRRQGVGRLRLRRRRPRARARRPRPPARPAPLLLEEREVGARAAVHGGGRAGLLGDARLPRPWRPLA